MLVDRPQELAGKVAVVTGAASGIGKASARTLLASGAAVVAADLNPNVHNAFDDLHSDWRDRLRTCVTDVSNETEIETMMAMPVEAFGRLDIVVNNAGLGGAIGRIGDIELADWRSTFAILVDGVFLGMKHAARRFMAQGDGGVIVNMASIAGLNGGVGPLAYSAAKAAVINMTQNAAVELAANHIRVNAICPGAIQTPMLHAKDDAIAAKAIADIQPWPEVGRAEQVAQLVLFLSGTRSEFITGQAHTIDGGLTAAGVRFRDLAPLGDRVGFIYGETGRPSRVRRATAAKAG